MIDLDEDRFWLALSRHRAWLSGKTGGAAGERLVLRGYRLGRDWNLAEVDLRRADLRGADISGVFLNEARLERADLRQARLRGAGLGGADLSGALLAGCDLVDANLYGAVLEKARGAAVCLHRANLGGQARLRGARLERADLRGANLIDADLRRSRLAQANLRGARLDQACLAESDLRGACLQGASLVGVDLEGCDLETADLRDADLSHALLSGAKLDGARTRGMRSLMAEAAFLGEDREHAPARDANLNLLPAESGELRLVYAAPLGEWELAELLAWTRQAGVVLESIDFVEAAAVLVGPDPAALETLGERLAAGSGPALLRIETPGRTLWPVVPAARRRAAGATGKA
ncbi:MAG: pentapeptide repeat-containing protein [Pseudomonadota bacterium]|nr:pentapeptide repeat-containing protein [Pseudomonadota bacterium]